MRLFFCSLEQLQKPQEFKSKNFSFARDKYSRHAQYYKMLLPLHSLNELTLGTRSKTKQNGHQKACSTRRRKEGRRIERDVRLKAEETHPKIPEKVDQEKFYAIEASAGHFDRNHV